MLNNLSDMPAGSLQKFRRGILVSGIGSFYTVVDSDGNEYTLKCRKKIRFQHLSPLPGDEVLFSPGEGEEHGWVEVILPRKTVFLRPPVANVSCLVIVTAPVPETDFLLVDRLLSRAEAQQMRAVLIANKSDMDPSHYETVREQYSESGYPVLRASAMKGSGIDEIRKELRGELCCFAGQSGAGKSTLLNGLMGIRQETGEISRKIQRGKNTTRHIRVFMDGDLRVIDTAGFNLLEPERFPPGELKERYPEFRDYEGLCRFRECLHDTEPGCAVIQAVGEGRIPRERFERYRILLNEVRETWRNRYD